MSKKLSVALVTRKIAKKAFHTIKGVSVTSPHTLEQAIQDSPDVIIIDDEDMPDDIVCDAKILIVCDSPKEKILQQVHHQGFSGFIQPDISSEEMQKVIRTVQKDEIWVNREIIATVFGEFSRQIKKRMLSGRNFYGQSSAPRNRSVVSRSFSIIRTSPESFQQEKKNCSNSSTRDIQIGRLPTNFS
jgi:DNA-binding NarL/FixJ family response regulator